MSEPSKPSDVAGALPGAPRPDVDARPDPTPEETETRSEPSAPQLPPKDYAPDARMLQYRPPAPPLPRDRTLVRFFRFLASLLFWGGSAAGLSVVLFRSIVLPRLAVLSSRLTALHTHHLEHYGAFSASLRRVASANGELWPNTADTASRRPLSSVKDEAVQAGLPATGSVDEGLTSGASGSASRTSQSSETAIGPVVPSEEHVNAEMEPTMNLTTSIVPSISALTAEVHASTRTAEDERASPSQKLVDTLETLSSYISTQSFYATQNKLHLGGGGNVFGQGIAPAGMEIQNSPAGEAAAQCRSEIRGLKGLLLNRRNFALLDRDWGNEELTTSA